MQRYCRYRKRKFRRGGKVKHREKRLSESLCSAVSQAASKIQIRSQRERCALRCAKTALLNLPPGWFPPPLSFPPLRLPSCARSLARSLRTKLVTPLFSYCADTRPFSHSRLPFSYAHTRFLISARSLMKSLPPPHLPLRSFSLAFLEIQSSA